MQDELADLARRIKAVELQVRTHGEEMAKLRLSLRDLERQARRNRRASAGPGPAREDSGV